MLKHGRFFLASLLIINQFYFAQKSGNPENFKTMIAQRQKKNQLPLFTLVLGDVVTKIQERKLCYGSVPLVRMSCVRCMNLYVI